MSADAAIQAGRGAIEDLMTDTCDIYAPAVSSTFNPATGTNTALPGSAVYSGQCRIQIQQPQPGNPDASGHRFTIKSYILQLPVSATTPPVGAVVTITGSFDPENVGRVMRVGDIFRKSHATSQRIFCEEVVE